MSAATRRDVLDMFRAGVKADVIAKRVALAESIVTAIIVDAVGMDAFMASAAPPADELPAVGDRRRLVGEWGQLGFTPAERKEFERYRLERRAQQQRDGWEPIWRGWMVEGEAA